MPTTMEGDREGGNQKDGWGGSQTSQASHLQQLWVLYFPAVAWPAISACFPRELPEPFIARGELVWERGKWAQPDVNSLG